MSERQIAFLFSEAGTRGLEKLGGKGFGLVEMAMAGFPVPPGFIITTGVCRAYHQEGRLPNRLFWQVERCIKALEKQTGKQFGGRKNPLLVAVRSGAKDSMPGMMETVLNLGLTHETLQGLIDETKNEQFGQETNLRFKESFRKTVLDNQDQEIPSDPWQQLYLAIEAVCKSWNCERAVEYRRVNKIPDHLGTAVVIQAMVFGNMGDDSLTGVVFSRNVNTGKRELYGEYLRNAQGEELVSGVRTPNNIDLLVQENPDLYLELGLRVEELEAKRRDAVDVEFTVEHGKLYLLQVRNAKRTPVAAVKIAVEMVKQGLIDKKEAIKRVTKDQLNSLTRPAFNKLSWQLAVNNPQRIFAHGLPASEGAAIGIAVFDPQRARILVESGASVVLIRKETKPEDFPGMIAAKAIVTEIGGVVCHAAVVARGLGIPAVVGAGMIDVRTSSAYGIGLNFVHEGDWVSVDGNSGVVVLGKVETSDHQFDCKVATFLGWVEEYSVRKATLKFDLVNERCDVNAGLNNYYIAEALLLAVKGSDLEREVRSLYFKVRNELADVFSVYLVLALASELTHTDFHKEKLKFPMEIKIIEEVGIYQDTERTDEFFSIIAKFLEENLNKVPEFVQAAEKIFRQGSWLGYMGGIKWAIIAQTLLEYLAGKLPPALFVDRVFDLRHNSGPVFNKHQMVRSYSAGITDQLNAKRDAGDLVTLVKILWRLYSQTHPDLKLLLGKYDKETYVKVFASRSGGNGR